MKAIETDNFLNKELSLIPEQRLFLEIIGVAFDDAFGRKSGSGGKWAKNANKEMAYAWLMGNSKEFIEICTYAGLEPSYVKRKAKEYMDSGKCLFRRNLLPK